MGGRTTPLHPRPASAVPLARSTTPSSYGGYAPSNCPTPLLHLPTGPPSRGGCECPMCYHSVRSPCPDCGCPSNTVPKSLKGAQGRSRGGPAFTDQRATQAFFSPSSDYYSLSPDSPPPVLNQSPEPLNPPQQPVPQPSVTESNPALKINNLYSSRTSPSPQSETGKSPSPQSENGKSASPLSESGKSRLSSSSSEKSVSPSGGAKPLRKPSLPDRPASVDRKGGSRRHSWAGDKARVPASKPTSLQDFKRLLSQQPLNQNQHRISAKEILLNQAPEPSSSQVNGGSGGSGSGGSFGGSGGSLRKRTSPWRDPRFSVIQEENEENRKSRDNLCD